MDTNKRKINRAGVRRGQAIDGITPLHRKRVPSSQQKAVKKSSKTISIRTLSPATPVTHETFPVPRYAAPDRPKQLVNKKRRLKRRVLQGISLIVTMFIVSGGFLAWKGNMQIHKVFRGISTVAALSTKKVDPNLLNGEGDGRVNILLMGIGGAGHDGPDLTDTLLVLSVDPVNNTAALLSVPRDLWVKMPTNYFGSYQKINAAYESGKYSYLGKLDASNDNANAVQAGFASEDQVFSDVLGIHINYHVLVNFQAFRQAVDTVGGVTVNVPTELYDPTMAWENNWNPILALPGVQTMNGVKALQYARSRETTSDFARTERQRQIILALKDKVMTAGTLSNPAKIDGLMNAFGNNVYSDLSTQGAERLYSIFKKINNGSITSLGLAQAPNNFVTTGSEGNTSIVEPSAGLFNYTDIQTYIRSQLVDGYITKEHAGVMVVGATAVGANSVSTELKSYGYNVLGAITTANVPHAELVDLSAGKDSFTKHYLEQRYGVKMVSTLPVEVVAQPGSTKFVIIETK